MQANGRLLRMQDVTEDAHIQKGSASHYDLLIIMPASGARDKSRMETVRSTWTRDIDPATNLCRRCNSQRTIKYLFVLGDEATADQKARDDVVVLSNCSSAYDKLAEKVERGIHHAVSQYGFNVLLKTDTDSWIFLDRLLRYAETQDLFSGTRSAQAGEVRRKGKPGGAKSLNPDAVFSRLTSQDTYPVYMPGAGYLLTRDLCEYVSLLTKSDKEGNSMAEVKRAKLPAFRELPEEDVSMGWWLQAVEHEVLPMPLATTNQACTDKRGDSLVLDHWVTEDHMRRRWKNLLANGDPCHD
eukprot:TRINITY_DN29780_c0_g2_i1.p1 TRINITY_DN29780_c0_g2~~TRINITY_DN29780_c0_g2_i1.p1  ORF type:complete len:348 (-),score=63.00 TRINITY_DN29780_c0_g2_i1:65-958(-)